MGVGAFGAGIFHLLTHAFFKALLFLGSGSVILALHHEQDLFNMGGLRKYLPVTFYTMWMGALALAGVPFFFRILFQRCHSLEDLCGWKRSPLGDGSGGGGIDRLLHVSPHVSRLSRKGAIKEAAPGHS